MKITMLSTSDINGGAAVSCIRIHESLLNNGMDSHMLVQDKRSSFANVETVPNGYIDKKLATARYAMEKLLFLPQERDKSIRFQFSTGDFGVDISMHHLIQQADIIHLNWINQGFLSIGNIEKLLSLGKPVFWILHDMWSFTGGCHYAGDCPNFLAQCGNCKYLKHPSNSDLSHRIWKKKAQAYKDKGLTIVSSSKWLAGEARKSSLFSGLEIHDIPTPINSTVYYPIDKAKAKQQFNLDANKRYLLFGAMSLGDERKGFKYFKEAIGLLDRKYPELKNRVELILFGKGNLTQVEGIPFKVNFLGSLTSSEQLLAAYNSSDVFVLPTLEDNLPNTIIEALACGVPSVAFNCTGVPEIIDHLENGYLAELRSSQGIADGIEWILNNGNYQHLSEGARNKALTRFSGKTIATQYQQLYTDALAKHRKK